MVMAGEFNNTNILGGIGLGKAIIEFLGIGAYIGLNSALATLIS